MYNFKLKLEKIIILTLFISILSTCFACNIGKKEVLGYYEDQKCEYIATTVTKNYKYRDYIIDDITDGSYMLSSPSISDYKVKDTLLDYDIVAYTDAKTNYELKLKAIKAYEGDLVDICRVVRENVYKEKSSMLFFHDIEKNTTKLLSQNPVTNLYVDKEIPYVNFSTLPYNASKNDAIDMRRRKIKLSDLIAIDSSPEDYIKIMLLKNKELRGYFRDQRIEDGTQLRNDKSSRVVTID